MWVGWAQLTTNPSGASSASTRATASRSVVPSGSRPSVSTVKPKRIQRDIFAYFDNDVKVYAPFDAQRLYKRVAQTAKRPRARDVEQRYPLSASSPRAQWPPLK